MTFFMENFLVRCNMILSVDGRIPESVLNWVCLPDLSRVGKSECVEKRPIKGVSRVN